MGPSPRKKAPLIVVIVLAIAVLGALAVLAACYFRLSPGRPPTPKATPAVTQSAVFVTPEPTPVPTPTPTPTPTPSPTPEPTPVPVELGETEDAGQEYIDKIVFLGDSSIYWLAGHGILPFTQVWTDAEGTMSLFNVPIDPIRYFDPATPDTAESLLIPDCAARRKPEILLITLGLNGIAMLDEQQFRSYYTDMLSQIQAASPDTKIILQSILPVMDSRVPRGISNEKIDTANQWIYSIAEQMGVRYLNSQPAVEDENGQLRADYNDDLAMGIHMNPTGFEALLQHIRTHAWL